MLMTFPVLMRNLKNFHVINSTHWSWIFHVNIWAVYNMEYIHEEQMKEHLAKIGIYRVCYVLILPCLESFFS